MGFGVVFEVVRRGAAFGFDAFTAAGRSCGPFSAAAGGFVVDLPFRAVEARAGRVLNGARGHTPAARGRRDGRLTQLHLPSTTSLLRWWGREAVQQLPETVVDRRQVPLHRVPWGRQPPAHQGASVPAEATPIFGSISVPPRTCLTLWRIASVSKSPSSTGAIPPPTRIESGALTNTSGCS